MQPARAPRWPRDDVRLLVVARDRPSDRRMDALPELLEPGDVVVVNQAATLPASLVVSDAGGRTLELRLAQPPTGLHAVAVLFGEGDWRTRTEDRPSPPPLEVGDRLVGAAGMSIVITAVDPSSPRLLDVRFEAEEAALWTWLYDVGQPVQYSHLEAEQPLWAVQTAYASRPWAVENPSAGRPLSIRLLEELRGRGVTVVGLTHAAGLSATGDPSLDARLPLPERYEIPEATVRAIEDAPGRVVAVGTTVVRALEDCVATHGRLVPGHGVAHLRLGPSHSLEVVDVLLTGMHDPAESHFELLEAFAPRERLRTAHDHARRRGYLGHEHGDVALVQRSRARPRSVANNASSSRPGSRRARPVASW